MNTKTTKQINYDSMKQHKWFREQMKLVKNNDEWNELYKKKRGFGNEVWVSLDELKKEIKSLRKKIIGILTKVDNECFDLGSKEEFTFVKFINMTDAIESEFDKLEDLCNSQEQKDVIVSAVGEDKRELDESHSNEKVSPSSSPVQNHLCPVCKKVIYKGETIINTNIGEIHSGCLTIPKKCTCKGDKMKLTNGIDWTCGRCGGEL